MPEEIITIPEEKIIKIISYGKITNSDLLHTFQMIKYFYETENFRKVLVDMTKQISMTDYDDFLSVVPSKISGLHVACVYSETTQSLSSVKQIGENQNFATFNYFVSEKEAISWLNSFDSK